MEGIYIPDVDTLRRLADELDDYLSCCTALSEYMENLTNNNITMVTDGMPVPMYVLRKLAYKQHAIVHFGGVETKKFISAIADVAGLYGMWPRAEETHPTSTMAPLQSFNAERIAALRRSTDQLLNVIDSHTKAHQDLQEQQQICWKLGRKASILQTYAEAFEEKYAGRLCSSNVSQSRRAKLQQFADITWDARDDVTKNQITYCEMVDKESNVKDAMFQISDRIQQYIHDFLVKRVADCIGNANKFLQSAYRFQEAHVFNKRHLPVIHTICEMRKGVVADELIAQASTTYAFPDTKEYPVYMEDTPKLPPVKLDENIGSCVQILSKTVVGSLRLSGNLNGYSLKISGRVDAAPQNPGFFHLNKDLHVKCKLGMFNGDVGFGWTRKSCYSRVKTWGFFMRPPSLSEFLEHVRCNSSTQDPKLVALGNPKMRQISDTTISSRESEVSPPCYMM